MLLPPPFNRPLRTMVLPLLVITPLQSFAHLTDGQGNYADFHWDCDTAAPPSAIFQNLGGSGNTTANGICTINGSFNARNQSTTSPYQVIAIDGANNSTGMTIEMSLQVHSGQTDKAFGIRWTDENGSVAVWFSDDKIEAGPGGSGGTLSSYSMVTDDQMHTYRITQDANSNTVNVYVDNNPNPAISAATGDNVTLGGGRIHFGRLGVHTLDNAQVDIDYMSFQSNSAAPLNDIQWDAQWDGTDSAASGTVNHLRWDSAIDDDWNKQTPGIFQLNTPATGLMHVDRVTNPADAGKTGNIWVRDPVLADDEGFTLEMGVLIDGESDTDAFSITYLDDGGSFGVHLSPDNIKVGKLGALSASNDNATFDTADHYHLYRIVKDANGQAIRVYVDNNPEPVVSGNGAANYKSGANDDYLKYPRILIGDNENNIDYNAKYTLDFVRYRRGAVNPGATPNTLPSRVLPSLPTAQDAWTFNWDGDTALPPSSPFANIAGNGNSTTNGLFTIDGSFNARNQQTTAPFDTVDLGGADNSTGITIEMALQVDNNQSDRAFGITWTDGSGSTGVWWSADKIEAGAGLDNTASLDSFAMDTTDGIHLYRITQAANSNTISVYVDNQPVAKINAASGDTLANFSPGRLHFGRVGTFSSDAAKVDIDFLRVKNSDSGPVAWNVVYEGDGQPTSPWGLGGASAWRDQSDGTTILDGVAVGAANATINDTNGTELWTNMAAVTVELRAKVLPGSEPSACNLIVNDQLGATALTLDANDAQLQHYSMPIDIGTASSNMAPGTTDYHTYRLTREAGGLYWHLYIDDAQTPSIVHQHADGNLIPYPRLAMGDLNFPVPANNCKMQIDYLRWVEQHIAPAQLP